MSSTSDSSPAEFVDANILVYALDSSNPKKQARAQELLTRLWDSGMGRLSIQVLQEFYVTLTRKITPPLPKEEAFDLVRDYTQWHVFSPSPNDLLAAIELQSRHQVSFWDAMVIQAAIESDCSILWTEDMNHGQTIGGVRLLNPFVAA